MQVRHTIFCTNNNSFLIIKNINTSPTKNQNTFIAYYINFIENQISSQLICYWWNFPPVDGNSLCPSSTLQIKSEKITKSNNKYN